MSARDHTAPGVILLLTAVATVAAFATENFGHFVGSVVAEWNDDGRRMTLVKPFAYVDPVEQRWDAPSGSIVDGASIPQFAWSIIGGPFEGNYRAASVLHDVACDDRSKPWQQVHLMFYNAMRAGGVGPKKAKVMYAAVYHFGPRWERSVVAASNVPLEAASSVAAGIRPEPDKGETSRTFVAPRSRPCPNCVVPLPPTHADIIVTYSPSAQSLSRQDFEILRKTIEKRDLSIGDVEDYGRTAPP